VNSKVPATPQRRARTPGQKEDRRAAILAAAVVYARECGFDGVTMSGLAARTGLAKGTLYLYFQTREELFLALYLDAAGQWCARIAATLTPGMSDDAAVEALTKAAGQDRLFIELASRLSNVIERNVPREAFIAAKRAGLALYMPLSRHLEDTLRLAPNDGFRFGTALMALLLGAAQIDSGRLTGHDDLPDDVVGLMERSRFETVFSDGLRLLLAGARPGAPKF
jgi:AcrR family transcriptional regulator